MSKFEITKRKNGEYQFNLKAGNGEVILTSEGYVTKSNCNSGIDSVKNNSVHEERYEKKTSSNNQFYFNLKSTNGQVVGTSEMYTTESARNNGITSVMKNAPVAEIVDLTMEK